MHWRVHGEEHEFELSRRPHFELLHALEPRTRNLSVLRRGHVKQEAHRQREAAPKVFHDDPEDGEDAALRGRRLFLFAPHEFGVGRGDGVFGAVQLIHARACEEVERVSDRGTYEED